MYLDVVQDRDLLQMVELVLQTLSGLVEEELHYDHWWVEECYQGAWEKLLRYCLPFCFWYGSNDYCRENISCGKTSGNSCTAPGMTCH